MQLARALATGEEWDLGGGAIPATLLVSVLTAAPPPGAPALRLRRATVTGVLRMTGARVGVPSSCGGARSRTRPTCGWPSSPGSRRPGRGSAATSRAPALASPPGAAATRLPVVPGGIVDPAACPVADRVHVDGNLELDDGLSTEGTVRPSLDARASTVGKDLLGNAGFIPRFRPAERCA